MAPNALVETSALATNDDASRTQPKTKGITDRERVTPKPRMWTSPARPSGFQS
jgi:hypothetical protein